MQNPKPSPLADGQEKRPQRAHPKPITLPSPLAEVALVDARTAAATGGVSENWWFDRVRSGSAPKPAVRLPRFSRWLLSDVVAFWSSLPEQTAGSTLTVEIATRASRAARRASS